MDPYGFCVECTPGSSSHVNGQTYDACTCSGGAYKGRGVAYSEPDTSCAMVVSAGFTHTCVLFTDVGKIKCWGDNSNGQTGSGSTSTVHATDGMGTNLPFVDFGNNPKVVSVQTARYYTCVLFSNGKLKCFGRNNYGQLGLGDDANREDAIYLGNTGDAGFADVGTGRTVVSVHPSIQSTCVILDNTQVKCFGRNRYGILGLGDSVHRGHDANTMGDFLPAVDFGTHRHAVRLSTSGFCAMCALLNTAELVCWGRNYEYVFGMGISKDVNIGDNPGEMGDNLVAITMPTGKTVRALASTAVEHFCVVTATNEIKCWGGNADGQLGVGDTSMRGANPNEMGDYLPAVDL
ncbi:regulator of chromosome condensation 1/beta-lactamase-inhibitor protein II, partial [Baffinella frigidus]